ncbi:MBL fold metallo-hydrolase [Granulicella tundricola]|uniref:Beta-lactamase domain protein n=1 Tax=Granulicella tundricola (strain ATCC BAA-1859 / DSM 23138 / MP5ACTX9) TaxID=1198114 RepID=E8WWS8_GRATM|nr:MBL fold metallo-hydrolase [Granulicella tundricola]ADW67406.1 beta-lactamase domain protein [Granulicella tundricola MP5ACTX9]
MKISSVGEYGKQLTRLGAVNCFLVLEDDGYTLIDGNLKGTEDEILRAAGDVPIRRILLTHPHVDHVGSVDALMARVAGLKLLASERSIPILQVPPDLSLRPGEVGPIRGGTPGIATKVSQTVAEGDRLGSLLVIDTPGHIHGHQAFLDERDGTLYAGDEFGSLGKFNITGFMPWWFPLKAFSNRDQAKDTARKLQGYPVQRVACGHGRVLEGGRELVQGAIDRAKG